MRNAILGNDLKLNRIQTHWKMYPSVEWRFSRAPLERDSNPFVEVFIRQLSRDFHLLHLNGKQSHLKRDSSAEWRVSRAPLNLNGIQTHSKMYSPAGWSVSRAPLGACLLLRPEVRLVNKLGASVPFVGNHATQVARVTRIPPLEKWVQRVVIMWFIILTGLVLIADESIRTFCTQLTQRIVVVFKQGCILTRSFTRERKHVTLKIDYL